MWLAAVAASLSSGRCELASAQQLVRDLPESFVPGRALTVMIHWDVFGPGPPREVIIEVIPPAWSPGDLGADSYFDALSWTIYFWPRQWGLPEWGGLSYNVVPPPDHVGPATFQGSAGESTIYPRKGMLRYRPLWATVQKTIDSSLWGDTVMVSGGESPFVENIVMKPGVNLMGYVEWPTYQPPVIEAASPSEPAITAAPYTRISGFVIRSSSVGISVSDPTVEISNCVITGTAEAAIEYVGANEGKMSNCTIVNNAGSGILCQEASPGVVVSNSILFANGGKDLENCTARFCLLEDEVEPGSGEKNIFADPMFIDPATGDYRLLRESPCIDAGDSSVVGADEKDILGKPRILFGGKADAVDIGAYEYWFTSATPRPGFSDIQLAWSSRPGKTYSVSFSADLITWVLGAENVPASDGTITVWSDPIGWPPTVPMRFYRILESE
jgi:hypothetical protein